jgi:hypothetical protein
MYFSRDVPKDNGRCHRGGQLFIVLRRMDPCCCRLVWLGRDTENVV